MAKLNSAFSFTGRIGNLSAYRMKGIKEVILRVATGPTGDKIKKDPAYGKQRRNNTEFGACCTNTKHLRKALFPLEQLGDGFFTGELNKTMQSLLVLDTSSEPGKRNVCISKSPKLFEGIQFRQDNTFDSIVRNPLPYEMSKDTLSARIQFPALIPGINFIVPATNYPFYSFIATIGIVPDMLFANEKYMPTSIARSGIAQSAWYPVLNGSPEIMLNPDLTSLLLTQAPTPPFTLMLSVGIFFGTIGVKNKITQVKKAGAGKIVGME